MDITYIGRKIGDTLNSINDIRYSYFLVDNGYHTFDIFNKITENRISRIKIEGSNTNYEIVFSRSFNINVNQVKAINFELLEEMILLYIRNKVLEFKSSDETSILLKHLENRNILTDEQENYINSISNKIKSDKRDGFIDVVLKEKES